MLSWDDFRIVKAVADRGSPIEAAKVLRINQSTVFRKLGQIEHRIGARLFKRNRSGYTLTPRAAMGGTFQNKPSRIILLGTKGGPSLAVRTNRSNPAAPVRISPEKPVSSDKI